MAYNVFLSQERDTYILLEHKTNTISQYYPLENESEDEWLLRIKSFTQCICGYKGEVSGDASGYGIWEHSAVCNDRIEKEFGKSNSSWKSVYDDMRSRCI